MKPLVYYCRWNRAALRLLGRDDRFVWGEFVYRQGEPDEHTQEFRFELKPRILTLIDGDAAQQPIQLDEMGVVVTSSAPDERE